MGARLVLLWAAANRDAQSNKNSDEIDVERHLPRRQVGFGWGIHLCIGAPFARLEARVAFEQLLARTRRFEVAPSADGLVHHRSLMIRRLVSLPLALSIPSHASRRSEP